MRTTCPKCLNNWSSSERTALTRNRICFSCGEDARAIVSAKEIHEYSITGSRIGTKEGQKAIAEIISRNFSNNP